MPNAKHIATAGAVRDAPEVVVEVVEADRNRLQHHES